MKQKAPSQKTQTPWSPVLCFPALECGDIPPKHAIGEKGFSLF